MEASAPIGWSPSADADLPRLFGRTFAASDVVVDASHVTAALAPLVTLQDSNTPVVGTGSTVDSLEF